MTMPKMQKSVGLGFVKADGTVVVFDVVAWRVRGMQEIEPSGICGCVIHRVKRNCQHRKLAQEEISTWVRSAAEWVDGDPIDWKQGEYHAVGVCTYDEPSEVKLAIVDPTVGDLSAFNLVRLLIDDDADVEVDDEDSFLNPKRILAELQESFRNNHALIASEVKAAGKKVPAVKASEIMVPDGADINPANKPKPSATAAARSAGKAAITAKRYEPLWKVVPRPNPKSFFVTERNWKELLFTIETGGNAILIGPSGCGKSEICALVAAAADAHFAAFNIGAMHEPRGSLIGNTHLHEDGTVFDEAQFVAGYRGPSDGKFQVLLLDEMTRDRFGAANILLPAMDRQRYLRLDEKEGSPVVRRGEKVSILATANEGMIYTQTERLDEALKQRFDAIIRLDWPPEANEISVLRGRCKGLKPRDAKKLVDIANQQRRLARDEDAFEAEISTRMLIAAGIRVAAGFEFADAVELTITNGFSDEGGDESEATKIRQIVQRGGVV